MLNFVLKNRDGTPVTHEDATAVNILLADGTEQMMLPGEAEKKTVELDFSGGDMVVVPSDGKLLTEVWITKPANLVAEHIAEGVDIAGIVGTLAAGGGGAKVEIVSLPYTEGGTKEYTLQHNLGVVPDIIFYSMGLIGFNGSLTFALGLSSALVTKYPTFKNKGFIAYRTNSSTMYYTKNLGEMDVLTSGKGFHNVTDKTFSIGDSTSGLNNQYSHDFLLIGGLT